MVLLIIALLSSSALFADVPAIDIPMSSKSMSEYYSNVSSKKMSLSQDDYPRFLDAAYLIYRQMKVLLPASLGQRKTDELFLRITDGKTPRDIIIMGAIMGLQRCEAMQLENELLQKDGDVAKNELYKIRAREANADKNFFVDVLSKYAKH